MAAVFCNITLKIKTELCEQIYEVGTRQVLN